MMRQLSNEPQDQTEPIHQAEDPRCYQNYPLPQDDRPQRGFPRGGFLGGGGFPGGGGHRVPGGGGYPGGGGVPPGGPPGGGWGPPPVPVQQPQCYDFGHSHFTISLSLTSSLLIHAGSSLLRYDLIQTSLPSRLIDSRQ